MKKIAFLLSAILILGAYNPINASGDFLKELKKVGKEIGKDILNGNPENTTPASGVKKPTKRRDDGKLRTESELDCYKLKVKSCTVNDNDVATIEFSIQNLTAKDINGSITNYSSKVYDDEGTCYDEDYILLAEANGDYRKTVYFKLPSELSMKFKMRVKDIDPSASVLKRVILRCWDESRNQSGYITIYNLPITREGDE